MARTLASRPVTYDGPADHLPPGGGTTLTHKFKDPQLAKMAAVATALGATMMAAAATAAPPAAAQAKPAAGVPFIMGSWEYSEPITTLVVTPGAAEQDFVVLITPGGFLRGVSLGVTSAGGVLGAGALAADSPWSAVANLSLESIDGTPLLYPKGGYAEYQVSKWCRPWDGDPQADPVFSNSVNPVFNLRYFIESRMTVGCLPNTDARAQYRMRLGVAPATALFSAAPTTVPTLTINVNLETWAQPPATDYYNNPIAQLPDGLIVQRFTSHEVFNTNGGNQILKSNRVGNLVRALVLIVRSNAGARVDLTADPIRWRLDNTQLVNELRQRRIFENNRMYAFGEYNQGPTLAPRPTGVYVYPRFHNPGDMTGQSWLPTTEASYLAFELNGAPAGGTVEIVTEDLAPAGPVPAYLQGI